MKLWAIFVATLVAAATANGGEPPESPFQQLTHVQYFAVGGTGEGGDISAGEKNFHLLLAEPSALAEFERLYSVGNLQAKAYALVGIRQLNHARFNQMSHSLRNSKDLVNVQSGCKSFDVPFGELLKSIASGRYSKTTE